MGKKKRLGCGCCCLPVILIVAFHVWSICKPRDYEFELRTFDKAPDLNQYSVEYNNPSGWDLKGHDEIYKAIFKEVFKELKSSKGRCIVRGKSHYDDAIGFGIISGLKRQGL